MIAIKFSPIIQKVGKVAKISDRRNYLAEIRNRNTPKNKNQQDDCNYGKYDEWDQKAKYSKNYDSQGCQYQQGK